MLAERTVEGAFFRNGFQGQERDDEVKGEGNSVNFSYRMHDPRVGRFFAVDPLTAKYPWYTPYQFSGNKVIAWVELEGLEESSTSSTLNEIRAYQQNERQKYITPSTAPVGSPLGNCLYDWLPSTANQPIDQTRNPTEYKIANPRPGDAWQTFIQYGRWEDPVSTATTQNNTVVNGQNTQIVMNGAPTVVNNPFVPGAAGPTPTLLNATNNARAIANGPLPAPVTSLGPTVQTANNTGPTVVSNDGMTRTTTNVTVQQQNVQVTTANSNVVVVSFNTTLTNTPYASGVLQARFNALNAAAGGGLVYNPGANQYRLTPAQMGGAVNQAVIGSGLQTTTTNSTTTTTTTTTTTQQFNTLR